MVTVIGGSAKWSKDKATPAPKGLQPPNPDPESDPNPDHNLGRGSGMLQQLDLALTLTLTLIGGGTLSQLDTLKNIKQGLTANKEAGHNPNLNPDPNPNPNH